MNVDLYSLGFKTKPFIFNSKIFFFLFVSAGDDTEICIWDYEGFKLRHHFPSNHVANIFCAKFMPSTNSEVIITCSMDGDIRFFNLNYSETPISDPSLAYRSEIPKSGLFKCHSARVKVSKLFLHFFQTFKYFIN